MQSSRSFIAEEILYDVYGEAFYNETLAWRLPMVYARAMERAAEYGYEEHEYREFALREMTREIWMAYSGGDTAYAAARRVLEAWNV